jgi:Restriction endonuclease
MATLENEIACLESDIARLKMEHSTLAKSKNRLVWYHLYHRFVRWFRSPVKSLPQWPLVVFAIGPLAVGAISLIAINEAYESWHYAIVGFWAGSLSAASTFAFLLFKPPSDVLPSVIANAEIERKIRQSQLDDVETRLRLAYARLTHLSTEMRKVIDSGRLQRELLLQRNWKAMRDDEWEDFLADVFSTLGANVQKTGRSGDQGVDLVVEFGGRRVAVQAKGYYHAVRALLTNSTRTEAARGG